MTDPALIRARILERLTAADSPWRVELAELAIDHLLGLPLRAAVDLEEVGRLIVSVLSDENVRRTVERHVAPGFARYAQAVAGSQAQVSALVSGAAHEKLLRLAHKLRVPEARWAQAAVEPALVRRLLAPVWTQVLVNFAKRLPVPGVAGLGGSSGAKATGITGFLSRSVQEQAEKLIDRGRSVMGGLGAEVERRLMAAARDFSDGAAQVFREALLERLESAEGRELCGQIVSGAINSVITARFADLQEDLNSLPLADVLDLVPDLVAEAAPSAFVREIVQREIDAWLALEGDRTLSELLREASALDTVRAALLRRSEQLTASLFREPAFADWLARLSSD